MIYLDKEDGNDIPANIPEGIPDYEVVVLSPDDDVQKNEDIEGDLDSPAPLVGLWEHK